MATLLTEFRQRLGSRERRLWDGLTTPERVHVLAIYRRRGRWGALAKSNYSGIRARAPVYHTIRELAMSYFEGFFNVYGERTMRAMTRPLHLARYDRYGWPWSDAALDRIGAALEDSPVTTLVPARIGGRLPRLDRRSRQAGELGARLSHAYHPPR